MLLFRLSTSVLIFLIARLPVPTPVHNFTRFPHLIFTFVIYSPTDINLAFLNLFFFHLRDSYVKPCVLLSFATYFACLVTFLLETNCACFNSHCCNLPY